MLMLEVGLRVFGSLDIHYYTGTKTPGLHQYPYGDVPINAAGFPDEEFQLGGTKRRVGYIGDSVTYGVGAGYGFRVPDLLQQQFPQYRSLGLCQCRRTPRPADPAGSRSRSSSSTRCST